VIDTLDVAVRIEGSGPGDLRAAGGKVFVVQGRVIGNPDDDALAVHQCRVYAMCQYANQVDLVDAASEQLVDAIPLGGMTLAVVNGRGLAVTEAGDLVVEADGMVALVRRR